MTLQAFEGKRLQGLTRTFQAFGSVTATSHPYGIWVSSDGVFITDIDTHQVKVYSTTGTLIDSWGGFGTTDGLFDRPVNIFQIGSEVFVKDNTRIQVFSTSGVYDRKFNLPIVSIDGEAFLDTTTDGTNIFTLSYDGLLTCDVVKLNTSFAEITRFGSVYGVFFSYCSESSGNIYVNVLNFPSYSSLPSYNDFIFKYTTSGTLDAMFSYLGVSQNPGTSPIHVNAGNIFAINFSINKLQVYESVDGDFSYNLDRSNAQRCYQYGTELYTTAYSSTISKVIVRNITTGATIREWSTT